ncbi:MAG: hypothetical protein KF870_03140 [Leadbetterella sp.]|nr:hypothetical protein [Leadbetterella sp.]
MERFLKNIFLFVIWVAVAYPFMIFLTGYFPVPQVLTPNLYYRVAGSYGYMFTRISEAEQLTGPIDILFLGSSHSYRGFDPRNFKGKKTFNLGSSSQTPIQTKILLERYLDHINPKMVIYEVYPSTFETDGVESSLDVIVNSKNDFRSVKMAFELNNIKTYNTLIYAGFADIFGLNKNFIESPQAGKDTYIPGGFVETGNGYYQFGNYSKSEWKLKDNQLNTFHECLELLKKKNVKTILVFAPITPRLYNSYTNNSQVDSIFNACNLEYYNFNRLMQINDSLYFFDSHHLNSNGVELFNQKLIETLKLQ